MLASVLKSKNAALVSIRIANAFVTMRKTLASIAPLLERIEALDRRQIDANQIRNEERFKLILIQPPRQEVLCLLVDGQVQHPGHPCENLTNQALCIMKRRRVKYGTIIVHGDECT